MTDTEQTAGAVQDQSVTPGAAPAEPVASTPTPAPQPPAAVTPAAPASQGPWSADLEARFADEATRSEVDAFLRDRVQPHVTNVEQSSKDARDLYDAFNSEPDKTFTEVATELYGPEAAKAIAEFTESLEGAPPEAPTAAQPQTYPPEVQELIDWQKEQKDQRAFEDSFARVKAIPGNEDIDRELFVPFVAQNGDFEKAAEAYHSHAKALAAKLGTGTEEVPAPTEAAAPPTVGSGEAAGTTTPPTQPRNETLDEALNGFFDDLEAQGVEAAPPVPST